MLFSSLLGRLTRTSKPHPQRRLGRRASAGRKSSFQPALETLEDRNLLSAGMLNPNFGTGGKTLINFGPNNTLGSGFPEQPVAAVLRDGTTILAGVVYNPNGVGGGQQFPGTFDLAVAEITKDGSPNPNFGNGGKTIVHFPNIAVVQISNVAVQRDGQIVVMAAGGSTTQGVLVTELNKDGTVNTSFGTGGKTQIDFPDFPGSEGGNFVLRPDGTILLYSTWERLTDRAEITTVAELTKHGQLNPHFGTGGETNLEPIGNLCFFGGGNGFAPPLINLVTLPDGKIMVASQMEDLSNFLITKWGVTELTEDGRFDNSFGTGGVAIIDFPAAWTFNPLVNFDVNEDGNILLGGFVANSSFSNADFAVVELTKHGKLNNEFGSGGESFVSFGANNLAFCTNFVVEPGGNIMLGGSIVPSDFSASTMGVAELTKDGNLNTAFGNGGTTEFNFGTYSNSVLIKLAVLQNGNIDLVGTASNAPGFNSSPNHLAVAQLTPSGSLNNNFGTGGSTIIAFAANESVAPSYFIKIEPTGAIVVAAVTTNNDTGEIDWGIAELTGKRHHRAHDGWENDD